MRKITTAWIEYVKRDIKAAEELLENDYIANIVFFHCQHAVEKVFKAVLEEHELDVPKIHNVIKLYNMLPKFVKTKLAISKNDLKTINSIYTNERYPGEFGLLPDGFPTKEDEKEIFDIASEIVQKTISFLDQRK